MFAIIHLNYYNWHYYDVQEVQMPIHTLHEEGMFK